MKRIYLQKCLLNNKIAILINLTNSTKMLNTSLKLVGRRVLFPAKWR